MISVHRPPPASQLRGLSGGNLAANLPVSVVAELVQVYDLLSWMGTGTRRRAQKGGPRKAELAELCG
ncbi:MAG: hypothetical protein J2P43_05945, partial [Candidatus Dormibacteraeota bacterium]|nr:hypothetical protein [Candidatus Dormibacteraeota bacterium]